MNNISKWREINRKRSQKLYLNFIVLLTVHAQVWNYFNCNLLHVQMQTLREVYILEHFCFCLNSWQCSCNLTKKIMIKKNEKRTPTSINLLTGSTYDLNVLSWSESNTVGKKIIMQSHISGIIRNSNCI